MTGVQTCALPISLNEAIKKYKREHAKKLTRGQLQKQSPNIYQQFNKYNLLYKYCLPNQKAKINYEEIIKEYHETYKIRPVRRELFKKSNQIYRYFYINNLLDKYCLDSTITKITKSQAVLEYNKNYKYKPTLTELLKKNSKIYYSFKRHNILDRYTVKKKTEIGRASCRERV